MTYVSTPCDDQENPAVKANAEPAATGTAGYCAALLRRYDQLLNRDSRLGAAAAGRLQGGIEIAAGRATRDTRGMSITFSEIVALASIGLVQLLAVMSPGPSFLVTARTAAAQSRRDGVLVALGLGAGSVVWAVAALLGLNALFHALPAVFVGMKVVGALFLLWIAWQIFRHAAQPVVLGAPPPAGPAGHPFVKGFMTQIANPKVAVFFGSIFVAMLPSAVPAWMAVALVAIVGLNEVGWYAAVALLFGAPRVRDRYLAAKAWIDRVTAVFLGALGARMLITSTETL